MNINWHTPSRFPALDAFNVHVWAASISGPAITNLDADLLSADESARALILPHPARNRFISSRVILRTLLANYLEISPRKIKFSYGSNGKPVIATEGRGLHFNMAHSGALALVAVSKNFFLGVDVEERRHSDDLIQVAKYFFSKNEFVSLKASPACQRSSLFFRYWTAKEAFIKAYGGKVCDSSLKRLNVCCNSKQNGLRVAPQRQIRWLSPCKGFSAALAYDANCDRVLCYKWKN